MKKFIKEWFRFGVFKDVLKVWFEDQERLFLCGPSSSSCRGDDFIEVPFSTSLYLDDRAPDVAFVKAEKICDAFNVVVAGDVKPFTESFSNDAKGQVISYGAKILEINPNRQFVYVFLTDCTHIQFFKVYRHNNYIRVSFSDVLFLWVKARFSRSQVCTGKGMFQLYSLLLQKDNELGFTPIDHGLNNSVIFNQVLSSNGISGVVFQVKYQNNNCVLKYFKQLQTLIPVEAGILNQLAEKRGCLFSKVN